MYVTMYTIQSSKSLQTRQDPSQADEFIVNTFMTVFVYLYGEAAVA